MKLNLAKLELVKASIADLTLQIKRPPDIHFITIKSNESREQAIDRYLLTNKQHYSDDERQAIRRDYLHDDNINDGYIHFITYIEIGVNYE